MAYATAQDMIGRFGLQELKALAPALAPGEPGYDAARVTQALADASAEIDSYLRVRFDVPLSDVPGLVVKYVCDLAREALDRQGRQAVLEAGKRARGWGRDIAQGKATLGSGPSDDPAAVPEPSAGGAAVMAPDRVFTDDALAAYLR